MQFWGKSQRTEKERKTGRRAIRPLPIWHNHKPPDDAKEALILMAVAFVDDRYFIKYHPDAFYETGLEAYLKPHNLSSIEICGAQTQLCIDTTIRIAFHLGFSVTILNNGFSTFDSDHLTAEQINAHHLSIWRNVFAKII